MDKLSRLQLRFDEPAGAGLEDMYQYLEEMLVKDDFSGVVVKYVDEDEDDEQESEREYNADISPSSSNIGMGHEEKMRVRRYNSDMDSESMGTQEMQAGSHAKKLRDEDAANPDHGLLLQSQGDVAAVEYNGTLGQAHSEGMAKGHEMIKCSADVLDIEYEAPELINGQRTYQRIVFEAERDGETVYETTMRKFMQAGMDAKAEYDPDFGTMIFTSLNSREEGADGNFNEFYLNGAIGENAIDQQRLKKGDVVEWRYAEETDGSCGGVPDFQRIKGMLQQYSSNGNGYGPPDNMVISPFTPPNLQFNYGNGR
ncbi:MAG: DUF4430 domain-containing protein [Candidatus Aenigmarchaeota archaeon]|nr:DUF4430 domain-containing protein [Candidatus Aenigmarchaeota archaeon]